MKSLFAAAAAIAVFASSTSAFAFQEYQWVHVWGETLEEVAAKTEAKRKQFKELAAKINSEFGDDERASCQKMSVKPASITTSGPVYQMQADGTVVLTQKAGYVARFLVKCKQ